MLDGWKRVREAMRGARGELGIAMVEAMIGTVLLVFAALLACQLFLAFHGSLAGHSAAARSARTFAITGQQSSARNTFEQQMETSLGSLEWDRFICNNIGSRAVCRVRIKIPAIIPGAGLFGGGGFDGPIPVEHEGSYPIGDRSGY